MIFPDKETFQELAGQGNLIPVYREIIADVETPVSAFMKLQDEEYAFLLESAESAEEFGRHSFVGSSPRLILSQRGESVSLIRDGKPEEYTTDLDPLDELKKLMEGYNPVDIDGLPIFYGGAVGFLSYESVNFFESTVPRARKDDLELPDAVFILTDTILIFDHRTRRLRIVANASVGEDVDASYLEALQKIEALEEKLKKELGHKILRHVPSEQLPKSDPEVNMTQDEYVKMTGDMQEHIGAGDIFQVVPSQRFAVDFDGNAIDLYRALRLVNPSPYMFCLKFGELALVGSSPETHVRCEEGKVAIRPIAGTRPRRPDPEEDQAMAEELLADPKEQAEHVMLIDLARNDVGRVCEYHTVKVTDFMTIERYSHVMHIVSHVEGTLSEGHSAYDVMRATFPAGTLTGAPKVRAMQIIADKEPTCRGTYGGAVGYFGFSGNLDSCIVIRTILLKDGKAYVQAGGGLVADSTPMGEYQESVNKAKAAMRSIELAKTFQ